MKKGYLVLQDGSNGGLTQVYYADAFGNIVGDPIDLSTMDLQITASSAIISRLNKATV